MLNDILCELKKEKNQFLKKVAKIEHKIDTLNSQQVFECKDSTEFKNNGCGKLTKINELIYTQTHWYTQPHGCTAGDYWNEGEGQVKCIDCEHVVRLIYSLEGWSKYKRYFKDVQDEHTK